MRFGIAFLASFSALGFGLAASPAWATDCTSIYSPCINDDTLWVHAGPARFVSVGSTETVAAGQLGFGLVTSYLSRPIILHSPSPGGAGSDQFVINDQVNSTFLWSYGVSNRLEVDVVLPLTFGQGGTGLAPITGGSGPQDTAVRDMRFGFAYAIVPHLRVSPDLPSSSPLAQRDAWGVTGRCEVSAPTGDQDQFAGERSGVFIPSLAGDYRHGHFFAGVELGARIRPTTELVGARVGTQLVTSLGAGYDILPRELLSATLEAWALPTLETQNDVTISPSGQVVASASNGNYIVPAEWQASLRTAPLRGGNVSIQLGGGGALPSDSAITTPRFRFTLGIRLAPLARDTDGDGVLDSNDHCPEVAAPNTHDGCPPTKSTSDAPVVELQLASARDVCTAEPEMVDGFKDSDGCPDEDHDKDGVPDRFDKCPLQSEDFAGMVEGCPGNPGYPEK